MIRAFRSLSLPLVLVVALAARAGAQIGAGDVPEAGKLVKVSAPAVSVEAGKTAEAVFTLGLAPGWHINANPANPDYMIATVLEITPAAGLKPAGPIYPAAQHVKVGFEETPLAVFSGQAVIRLPIATAPTLAAGSHTLKGTLRFQACNDQVCMAPATIPVTIELRVVAGAGAAATPSAENTPADSSRAPPSTAATTPPPGSGAPLTIAPPGAGAAPIRSLPSTLDNPVSRALAGGGWALFVTLFIGGLLLNLTPCVYPMIGVTVSIFGARRAAPPLQVVSMAILYVLGMAVMYSSLGVAAALTGGLFGGLLSNPLVAVGIGALMIGLSLSMFGLYEIQMPSWLLTRLGGNTATSALGTFVSGLVVGVFAAPCVGPMVVGLLAVVGAKGDPWFGFTSFFTLAMGLGLPYLVLAMFSNLIQALPRSGEWMVWVKKVFGVVLIALGLFYALPVLAPQLSPWVAPAAFVLGGVYLGFFERSGEKKAGFRWLKRASGAVAAVAGAVMVVTAPTDGIAFESFTPNAVQTALSGGQPVMLDFTANWCAPCHELERFTFSDRRVRDRARGFRAFRVDLTKYDSPESEKWRKDYAITGVPTVVFLNADGSELKSARVEGFLPPDMFLERMSMANASGQRAAE